MGGGRCWVASSERSQRQRSSDLAVSSGQGVLSVSKPRHAHTCCSRLGTPHLASAQALASRGRQSLLRSLGGRRPAGAPTAGGVAQDWSKLAWERELSSSPPKLWSHAWIPKSGLRLTYRVTLCKSLTFPGTQLHHQVKGLHQ